MPKMTKAQAKKRLNEAKAKVKAVYVASWSGHAPWSEPISTKDMTAIETILNKCLKRMN
jgi:hypothetical protein